VTKVGGLPYRPADAPWPKDVTGSPLRFIAQLCFVDSRDLVPSLPGDVLLVFGNDDALIEEAERLVFEWWPIASMPLISEVPSRDDALTPYHGVLHRTDAWEGEVFEGTKIAGLPSYIQGEPHCPGKFLAAIGSIANQDLFDPHPVYGLPDENDLMIGDMGSLYLFMQPDGNIQAVSQCY
jgi:uncharacterized protein YwqG